MKKILRILSSTVVVAMLLGFSIGAVQGGPCELPEFDVANFSSEADNPYLLKSDVIGKTYVYEADDEDGLILDYIRFTYDTKEILGVTCTVVYDVEYLFVEDLDGGEWVKLEETWDWHAWDKYGNFWYFGEDTKEYEYDDEWNVIGCNHDGAWEAGKDVARVGSIAAPGIILPADPAPGDCNQQECYEDEAEDVGKVLKVKATCEDPDGNESEECMVIKEWTALEPGKVEQKIYYPGKGLVHIKELKEKTVEVELVDINNAEVPNLADPICPD